MDLSRDSNSAPVYIVTDNQYYDEDIDGTDVDMAMSEVSSCRTMSTLSSGEVAGTSRLSFNFCSVFPREGIGCWWTPRDI